VQQRLQQAGFRVEIDARNEKMNARIRDLSLQKIPYVLVLGDKEESSTAVSVRTRGKGDQGSTPLESFIAQAQERVTSKSLEL
jgi:threonyl-tRNA synthetase